jgi:TP53 regulating kinase and related kinases
MTLKKILQQGAEAKIIFDESINVVVKDRIKKSYRVKELDDKIRKSRTRKETKLLEKAAQIINAPKPFPLKEFDKIEMPFIEGKKLSETLDSFPLETQREICKKIGMEIAKLHKEDIIHGDLTTSNLILRDNSIYFIDFGLGYISKKVEDKAVDLHLLKQALEARHFKNWEILFNEVLDGYKNYKESNKVLERLKTVEKRGRYKEH